LTDQQKDIKTKIEKDTRVGGQMNGETERQRDRKRKKYKGLKD
jgi:hypothetical protein